MEIGDSEVLRGSECGFTSRRGLLEEGEVRYGSPRLLVIAIPDCFQPALPRYNVGRTCKLTMVHSSLGNSSIELN